MHRKDEMINNSENPNNRCNKKIALTGGGSAGHVMLHIALLPEMQQRGWDIYYIGSKGIEKKIIEKTNIPFYTIATGKLRRYFSIHNFLDIFKIFLGLIQCLKIFIFHRPNILFSKGGFVSVPPAIAAWLLKIPVITHESDVTPGLANRILLYFSKRMLYSFPETNRYLPKRKSEFVGSVVRDELLTGEKKKGLQYCSFDADDLRPIVLIMGGSQGAEKINRVIEQSLAELNKAYRIIHIAGKGKRNSHPNSNSYVSFEFVSDELKHLFAACDMVISRAGANSIFEILALKKPMLLIPLDVGSRGDQIINAKSFQKNHWAMILSERKLNQRTLLESLNALKREAPEMISAQMKHSSSLSKERIFEVIETYL
ncbi:MAG: undecaprenyldiphospho-muramoylpentapeptide beta-N-acetylglucosaminyltransferase [Bdellovibrionota bacterium]